MARVWHRVPTNKADKENEYTFAEQPARRSDKEVGAGEHQKSRRAQRRAASVDVKIDFGVGTGRGAGFYKQYAKLADPATASEEAAAAEKARRRAERQRAERAAWEKAAKTEAREEREERAREQRQHERAKAPKGGGADGAEAGAGDAEAAGAASARPAALDLDAQRTASFAEYEAGFQAFRARALREGRFSPAEVPLPPRGQAIEPAVSLGDWQRNTKRALLRWHPDKWASLEAMLGDAEAEQLKQLIEGMFRAVSRAKDRGFLPQRWAAANAAARSE